MFGTLVGAGGGFILTPILLLAYPHSSPELITAISLVVVFFNASSGTAAYARQRRIDYRSGLIFAACTLPGSVLGVLAANRVSRPTFDVIMGAALLALALWLLQSGRRTDEPSRRGEPRAIEDRRGHIHEYHAHVRLGAVLSVGVGFVSSFLGIGWRRGARAAARGPAWLPNPHRHRHLPLRARLHVARRHPHAYRDRQLPPRRRAQTRPALSAGVVVGAQVGARLSQRLSGAHIERLLALALVALGIRLILSVVL